MQNAKKGLTFATMPLKDLRSRAIIMLRVRTYARSGDIGVINRTFVGDANDFAAGCHGTKSVPSIVQVRLMNHKIISSMRQTLFGYGDLEDIPYEQVMIIAQLQYHNH
jgi:hypothetical protein